MKQIAKEIADKYGYTLGGEIADIRVDRITQNKERDLTFLTKLAKNTDIYLKYRKTILYSMMSKHLKEQNSFNFIKFYYKICGLNKKITQL